jgi:5-methylcytosine-specific restriction endonuclease McrA
MTKALREQIYKKFNGKCAYSGTQLEDDWQVDHVKPIVRDWNGSCKFPNNDCENNMVPTQKIINHYKHSLHLKEFRTWLLGELHNRLAKLPKNPKVQKSIKRKEYLLKVAGYFNITPDKPFTGKFYFETLNL